jgi:hypothetical protein
MAIRNSNTDITAFKNVVDTFSILKNASNFKCFLTVALFAALMLVSLSDVTAQPNTFAPGPAGNKGEQSGDKGVQGGFTPEQIAEMQDAKNVWKTELAEESLEETNKLMVNYDSLYQVYYNYRKTILGSPNGAGFTYKVYPCFLLPKINGIDTNIYKNTVAVNKYYAKFRIADSIASNTIQANLRKIDDMAYPYKFKTTEIINSILPPLPLIQGKKMKAAEYAYFLNEFFGSNPELIYYCSKKYVLLIEKKQYDKLMKLHQNSLNILDYRDDGRTSVNTNK